MAHNKYGDSLASCMHYSSCNETLSYVGTVEPVVMVTLYYIKWPLCRVHTEQSTTVNSGQQSSLLQHEVLQPLYVGQAPIKPVHTWNFQSISRAAVNTEADAVILPIAKKKGSWLAGCPWNVSYFVTVFQYGHTKGSRELVSSVVSRSISPTVGDQTLLYS